MRYEAALEKHMPLTPYEQGLVDGIYRYAWMKDGTFFVGTTGKLLGDAIDQAITEYRRERAQVETG